MSSPLRFITFGDQKKDIAPISTIEDDIMLQKYVFYNNK